MVSARMHKSDVTGKHWRACGYFEHFCKNPELFPEKPPAKHHQFMIGALEPTVDGATDEALLICCQVQGHPQADLQWRQPVRGLRAQVREDAERLLPTERTV